MQNAKFKIVVSDLRTIFIFSEGNTSILHFAFCISCVNTANPDSLYSPSKKHAAFAACFSID